MKRPKPHILYNQSDMKAYFAVLRLPKMLIFLLEGSIKISWEFSWLHVFRHYILFEEQKQFFFLIRKFIAMLHAKLHNRISGDIDGSKRRNFYFFLYEKKDSRGLKWSVESGNMQALGEEWGGMECYSALSYGHILLNLIYSIFPFGVGWSDLHKLLW